MAETINSIVATVESQSITDYDLKKSSIQKSPEQLDQEIFSKLIRLDAQCHGINTNAEEVNFYLEQIAKNQGQTSEELFSTQLDQGQSPEAVRKEMELEILKQKLAQKLFQNSKNGLEQNSESIAKVNLSQIIIDRTKHEEAKADELAQKVIDGYDSGQTFELLVEQFSDASNKEDKGNLGELNWSDLDPNFRKELEVISPDQLTKPITKENLIFIFKLNEIIKSDELDPDEAKAELSPAETNRLLRDYFSKDLYKNYLIDKK